MEQDIALTAKFSTAHHSWDAGTITKEATYKNAGTRLYTCTHANCDATKTSRIPALGESFRINFTDVAPGSFYADAVKWAVYNKITTGTSATKFSPDATCTRAQVVTFLWRSVGSPTPKQTSCPFTDISKDDYFYHAVLWAVEQGITTGTSATKFSPNDPCTRSQVVTFLWRSANKPAPATQNCPFTDVPNGSFYYKATLWAVEEGITTGTGAGKFSPEARCTRSQVVTFLYRFLED